MLLEFCPRKYLVNWLMDGWSPVPGYEYGPDEFVFLLKSEPVIRSAVIARYIASELKREAKISPNYKSPPISNRIAGRASGAVTVNKTRRGLGPKISEEQKNKIIRRIRLGQSNRTISTMTGSARTTIAKVRADLLLRMAA